MGGSRRHVHALAAWLVDFAPAAGTALTIDFGADRAWTWRREPDHWSVHERADAGAHARITIAADHAVAVLSRGVAPDVVRDLITLDGDTELGQAAMAVVAPLVAPR